MKRGARILGVALPALLLAGACSRTHAPARSAPLPGARVELAEVEAVAHAEGEEVVGTVRARSAAALSASVMGTVRELKVAVGTKVRSGQLIARLAAQEIEAKTEQARALVAQADLDLRRAEELKAQNAIPSAQYDGALARQRVAKAALAEAEVMLGYTEIRAPFSGIVTAKNAEVGDLVLPGRPLLTIENSSTLRLEAAVPEALSQGLAIGTRMPVRIEAIGAQLMASVSEVSPTADPQSRSVLVKLDLPQTAGLRPGMFGRLTLSGGATSALTIPAAALVQRGQLETVFVAEGGVAKLRLVRTGREDSNGVEVLAGLDRGERVVISDPARLLDGQPLLKR